jgi:hypothetical protein
MGGWVLAAGGARCPYRAEGEGMRGSVVGSVGAGVSGLGRRQAWAWAREPDGDSGLHLQGLFLSPPKRPLIALPARLTVSARPRRRPLRCRAR